MEEEKEKRWKGWKEKDYGVVSVAALHSSNTVSFLEHACTPSASRGAEERVQEVEKPLHIPSMEEGGLQQRVQPRVEVWVVP